jgi:heat shock protein
MSPAVRVREFAVTDVQMYPVYIAWEESDGKKHEMKVFDTYHTTPFSRLLTVHKRDPFTINVFYDQNTLPYPDAFIGSWTIKDVKAAANGDPQEIKIKVRINQNGVVLIQSASMIERKEVEEPASPTAANGEQPATPMDAAKPSEQQGGQEQEQSGDQNNQKTEPMEVQEVSETLRNISCLV